MNLKKLTDQESKEALDIMSEFKDSLNPQVGIFWYNPALKNLFGISKDDAVNHIPDLGWSSIPKLHKDYWSKQFHRAVRKGLTESIYYKEGNYTKVPRGRVVVYADGTIKVFIGSWIDEYPEAKELVIDEFNLPEDVEFVKGDHWNIGNGWEGDNLK